MSAAPASGKKSSNLQTYINLMKAFVGSGLLGMPFAFRNSGIWLGSIAMIILSLITLHCILLLVKSQNEIGRIKLMRHLEEDQDKHTQMIDSDDDEDEDLSDATDLKKKRHSSSQSQHLLPNGESNPNHSDYESTGGTSENDMSDLNYQKKDSLQIPHRSSSATTSPLPLSATSTNAVEQHSTPVVSGQYADFASPSGNDVTEFSLAYGSELENNELLEKFCPNTFGEVGEFVLTRIGRICIELLLTFTQTGFCIAYLIFISSNMKQMLKDVVPLDQWAYVLIAGALLIPFALLRNIKYLTPFSIISEAGLIVGLAMVMYFDIITLDPGRIVDAAKHFPFQTFPVFLGLAIYSFEGVGLVLPIHNNMKKRSSFTAVVVAAFLSYLFLMMVFGLLGYLAYGDGVKDIITEDLEDHPIPLYVIDSCLIIALFFTYPMQLFPVPELADVYMGQFKILDNFVVRTVVRVFLVCLTMIGAILGGKYFGYILSYIGAVGGSSLAYTLPGLIHLILFWKKNSWIWRIKDFSLAVFGVGCLFLTVIMNTVSIVENGETAG